jgi:tetracycline repressor-like protein
VRASDREDAELRAAVLVSSILGVTIARHFIGLRALGDLDGERIAAVVEPWFASLLEGSPEHD